MEWVSSKELIAALGAEPSDPADRATDAIYHRAHDGILRARVETLFRNGENLGECDLPKEFWWAERDSYHLRENWVSGDFVTHDPDDAVEGPWRQWKAYGVEWCKEDAEKMGAKFDLRVNEKAGGKDLGNVWLSPFLEAMIETARKERIGPTPEETPSIECLRESMAEVARARGLADAFTPSLIRYAATLIRHPDAKEGASKWRSRIRKSAPGETQIV